ncbi:MAG: pilus assembly protein PilM [Peptococcaceae bacterium]|jgi:cell division protein FtsA|nr:pilus assembly protein PilM [Peptococcaceae bacterium]
MEDKSIFVIDIGTRTVIALLARMANDRLVVDRMIMKEHQSRSMLDGQIHLVDQVSVVVKELLDMITEASGQKPSAVAVAAAGRTLRTARGSASYRLPMSVVLTQEQVLPVTLEAVYEAQKTLPSKGRVPLSQQYYCVGYSVVSQSLDGAGLGSLIGQRGQEPQVDVVATFLPRIVVDSLQTVIQSAGLELINMTLEPIAVSNLVLNPSMRNLNLALVDIGAGTSDIAICSENSISAFGMVAMAGDEITEKISDHYLLDFNEAEKAKRLINDHEEIEAVDVLGLRQVLKKEDIMKVLEPTVDELADAIAKQILELNAKPPQAVLLVGGGSLTPGLRSSLIRALNLPESRVGIQQADRLPNIENLSPEFHGPNFITVLGIAYSALMQPSAGVTNVEVNDVPVRILNLSKNNVAEALINGGLNLRDIYGHPGQAVTFELNGQVRSIPGKSGKPGEIYLNGEAVDFIDPVKEGDKIRFVPGEKGEDAAATAKDLLDTIPMQCTLNDDVPIPLSVELRDEYGPVESDRMIVDGGKYTLESKETVRDVLVRQNMEAYLGFVLVNGENYALEKKAIIRKNGTESAMDEALLPGDHIFYGPPEVLTVRDFMTAEYPAPLEVTVNGEKIVFNDVQIRVNGQDAGREATVKAGDILEFHHGKKGYEPILVDIFTKVNFDHKNPPPDKNQLVFLVNGEEKQYTYVLQPGDNIILGWM